MATANISPSAPTLSYNSKRTSRLSSLSNVALRDQSKPHLFTKSSVNVITQKARTSQLESVGTTSSDDYGGVIRRLQNGSDVRGVALDGEPGRTVDLTPQAAQVIAESFGEWVTERVVRDEKDGGGDMAAGTRVQVSVGRDPRLSGPRLAAAVFSGLAKAGCHVVDMGLATTPACFMSTVLTPFNYDASIMMTASHLPYTRNGLKFFTRQGGLRSSDVQEICERAARKYVARRLGIGGTGMPPAVARVDFMSAYAEHLRKIIVERIAHPTNYQTPLKGFKVIVNAGNGSAGFFTWAVLDKLGADTTRSLHLEPDGMFPNHTPNPEDPKAMSLTREAVLANGADLGVVFDTDVDRSGVVDSTGVAINGDKLIALMSSIVLREHPGTTIVTDARASVGLTEFITAKGGHHCLYRVGYRNVIDKGAQLNEDGVETHLMMETTGHGALKENYFLDDGAYMVVKIIIEMVRMKLSGIEEGIGSLIRDLKEPAESVELRLNIVTAPSYAKGKGSEAVQTLKEYIQDGKLKGWYLDTCGDCWVSEGCLVDTNEAPADIDAFMYRAKVSDDANGQHGWIHIRQSVHNPNIALNMQSSVIGGCQSIAKVLLDSFLLTSGVKEYLDISQVEKFVNN
ncbi:Phosphomannomutase/phosphoglucomutase [Rhynchospora pubera]|uniref:phosphoglucomutase (alpha-D-glucose-1,6-bisphosphate-dependent) n=1 Tax=Rhynchospora pubera TaxID=906938 RepID=A0AAV8DNQ4_9POAL|nr:Phosphomannomutase/phosphoglucomutase [Rhynchospora pubera]